MPPSRSRLYRPGAPSGQTERREEVPLLDPLIREICMIHRVTDVIVNARVWIKPCIKSRKLSSGLMQTRWFPICMRYLVEQGIPRAHSLMERRTVRSKSPLEQASLEKASLEQASQEPDQGRIWPWMTLRIPCSYWRVRQISSCQGRMEKRRCRLFWTVVQIQQSRFLSPSERVGILDQTSIRLTWGLLQGVRLKCFSHCMYDIHRRLDGLG